MDPDGGKLSKRKGSTSVQGLLDEGYLPEALFNFVILAGWSPKDNKELFTLEEFVKHFDQSGFQKSNPVFNREKLDWFNGQYIRKLSVPLFATYASGASGYSSSPNFNNIAVGTAPLIASRITKFGEYDNMAGFFFKQIYAKPDTFGGNEINHLAAAYNTIKSLDKWDLESLNDSLMKCVEKNGFKTSDFFMDLRIAVAGSKSTPPINESIVILGKAETLGRLQSYV
jgi:glutamyl-tRNA synthetase